MSVWKAQDDHPERALVINSEGFLESYFGRHHRPDTNRQSYKDVYFYDQGPWVVKIGTIFKSAEKRLGCGPWWWMGEKCLPFHRQWITGRDLHSNLDAWIAEKWNDSAPPVD